MTKRNVSKETRDKLGSISLKGRFAELVKFRIPTGVIAFDRVTGGGIPAGKLTEMYGDYGTGKSRIACHILANTQKLGGTAVLIDTERSMSQGLADLTGIDVDSLVYPDPNEKLTSLEEVYDVIANAIQLLREENPDGLLTIVWDSVAATPGMDDLEKKLGEPTAAMKRAKIMSDGLKKLMADVHKLKVCLVFINQIRDRIGVMYGPQVDTVGGKALKFAASLRVHVKMGSKIKNDKTEEIEGFKGRMIVERSKVCKPFGKVEFDMKIDEPIDKHAGLLNYMKRHEELVHVGSGWYQFPGDENKFRAKDFPKVYEKRNKGDKNESNI